MSKQKKNKEKKNGKPSVPFTDALKTMWKRNRQVLYFLGGFCLLMMLFYGVWLSDFFIMKINPFIETSYAWLASVVLNLFGQQTYTRHEMLYSSKFSIIVSRGCDAVEAMAIFSAALLSFPIPWRNKIKGTIIGLLVLYGLNVFRIISLFLTGIYSPRIFDLMHIEVWEALFIFFALTLWIFFVQKSKNKKVNVTV